MHCGGPLHGARHFAGLSLRPGINLPGWNQNLISTINEDRRKAIQQNIEVIALTT
jgi:hypothetical protein